MKRWLYFAWFCNGIAAATLAYGLWFHDRASIVTAITIFAGSGTITWLADEQ